MKHQALSSLKDKGKLKKERKKAAVVLGNEDSGLFIAI